VADPLVNTNRARIHTLAMAAHLPTIYNAREFVEAGGSASRRPHGRSRRGRSKPSACGVSAC
jgi:hypothetical protein